MSFIDINDEIKDIILFFSGVAKADDLTGLKINDGLKKILLYPTNDLFLTKEQFEKFKEFLGAVNESEFLITQFGTGFDGVFSENNKIIKTNTSISYEDYYNLNLYSLSMIFSAEKKWAIFIDETAEAGIGLFVGTKEVSDIFGTLFFGSEDDHQKYLSDIKDGLKKSDNEYLSRLIEMI